MSAVTTEPMPGPLSDDDRELLDFEGRWWTLGGSKEDAIADHFGISSVQYYQRLNLLLDSPAALAADPMLVKRLRRMRDARQAGRGARGLPTVGRR